MKITIGKPARGDKFYPRDSIREQIIELLIEESNVLISAPRRVGKTSVLMNLYDNPPENYIVVYVDTEAQENTNGFYKKLLNELFDLDLLEKYNHIDKGVFQKLTDFANKIKSFQIAGVGVEMKQASEPNYHDKFVQFLDQTDLKSNKILMLVDEFPVTVENIHRKHGFDETKKFLQLNRAIRLHPKLNSKIQFIYTGSIGIINVLSRLKITEDVNDLTEFFIPPLSKEESLDLLIKILNEYDVKINPEIGKYVIRTIEWQIPFYIQSFAREVRDLYRKEDNPIIDEKFIDRTMLNVIDNVNIYLDHYRSRLDKTFSKEELALVNRILNRLSQEDKVDVDIMAEMAAEFGVMENLRNIISTLEYDGYINNKNEEKKYRFNSPIMKLWWQKYGDK